VEYPTYPISNGQETKVPTGTGLLSLFLSVEGSTEEISELNTALRAGPVSDTVRVLHSRLGYGERGIAVRVTPVAGGDMASFTQIIPPGSSGRFDVSLVAIGPDGQLIRLDCPLDVRASLS